MVSRRSLLDAAIVGVLALGLAVQAVALGYALARGTLALDFVLTYGPAGEALLEGRSPYPEFGYPPLVAYLSAPFALLPARPEVAFALLLAACVPLSLWILGVRDWRCYAAAFCWAPVFHAIQTGNVTLLLLLGAAVCWRLRDSTLGATAGGLTAAAKLLTWPLALWLAATRRWQGLGVFVGTAAGVTALLWWIAGFPGLRQYVGGLDELADRLASDAYTLEALALDLGAQGSIARAIGLAVLGAFLAGVLRFGSRADDRRAFACAIAAAVFASPLVWLHSFALLLAAAAVLRPRFSLLWLLPAVGWVHTGNSNGTPLETAVTLFACLLAIALLLGRQPEPRLTTAIPSSR